MLFFRKPPLLTLCAALLVACGNDEPDEGPRLSEQKAAAWVTAMTEGAIVPLVEDFYRTASSLSESAEGFCDAPDEGGWADLRSAYGTAARAWYRLQLYHFGPAVADPVFPLFTFIDSLRLRGTDYRETVDTTLRQWRDSEDELDSEFFEQQRFQYVGLLAIETALYEESASAGSYEDEPVRCAILQGLTRELEDRAAELQDGWTVAYEDGDEPFSLLLVSGRLPDGTRPVAQLIVAAQQYTDYLHNRHVVTVAGHVAGIQWQLMEAAYGALEDFLVEGYGSESLFELLEGLRQQAVAEAVQKDLDAAQLALDSEDVTSFEEALLVLDGDFKRDIPQALGIDLGLTLTDGD